jgi:aspartate carbamoyltransferase regulatory subunit
MNSLEQNKCDNLTSTLNEHCICRADNITMVTMYHTNDSLSYLVARCNYCREEWAEYWISYRYIFSSLIFALQQESESVSDE